MDKKEAQTLLSEAVNNSPDFSELESGEISDTDLMSIQISYADIKTIIKLLE